MSHCSKRGLLALTLTKRLYFKASSVNERLLFAISAEQADRKRQRLKMGCGEKTQEHRTESSPFHLSRVKEPSENVCNLSVSVNGFY